MSISLRGSAMGLERLIRLKYIVTKKEIRFTFWLNAAKITNYIKKLFK